MYNIAVIGAGQIGSRHIQGLARVDENVQVYAVDKSIKSLELAEQRFQEVLQETKSLKKIVCGTDIDDLPEYLDIAIIATNSDTRKAVIDELIGKRKVKYLILEKVLFNKLEDYDTVLELVQRHNIKAWVNCPRRMYEVYRMARDLFKGRKDVTFRISGTNWGLGCNGIHYIDAIAFILDSHKINLIDASEIDNRIIESKRKGFIEFTGNIKGEIGGRNKFSLVSNLEGSDDFEILIRSGGTSVTINETTCEVKVTENNKITNTFRTVFPFQSQLTNKVVEQLIADDDCELTSLEESVALHKPLLKAFLLRLNKLELSTDTCNIT